jgi:hypothetical protein
LVTISPKVCIRDDVIRPKRQKHANTNASAGKPAAGLGSAAVAGLVEAAGPAVAHHAAAAHIAGQRFGGAIAGAVVNDDQFPVRMRGVGQEAADAGDDGQGVVVERDDDGND